ncbi:MAG: deoxyribonuclease, partial [Muribaculaceae bacterium]|nr:deoxyribonuclease [Muribaculaceae bacterium]
LSFGLKFNPQAVAITPLDRLLVETDDATTPGIDHVVQAVAQARGCSARSIKRHVRRNALRIIKYK